MAPQETEARLGRRDTWVAGDLVAGGWWGQVGVSSGVHKTQQEAGSRSSVGRGEARKVFWEKWQPVC